MTKIQFKTISDIPRQEILKLYEDAGWTEYLKEKDKLLDSFSSSLLNLSAWEKDTLVGLIRLVGDGKTIIYIQDLLVLKKYQNQGIGSELMKRAIEKYNDVRQKVLLTDNNPELIKFYKANRFKTTEELNLISFVRTD